MRLNISPTHEQGERELVRKYVPSSARVLEGGAGIGGVTRELTERASFVVSCEPQYSIYEQARRNAPDALLLPLPLTPQGEPVQLHVAREWWNTSIVKMEDLTEVQWYPTVSASDLINRMNIDTLVLDIEGYEVEFFSELGSALNNINLIIMEVHPHRVPPEEILGLLEYLSMGELKEIERIESHPMQNNPTKYPDPGLISVVFSK